MHLKGLGHGTEMDVQKRIESVINGIEQQEKIAKMLQTNDVDAIKENIEGFLSPMTDENAEKLLASLTVWNSVSMGRYKYPVESLYPVKKAIALLSLEDQRKLKEVLTTAAKKTGVANLRIIDELRILIDDLEVFSNWIENNATELDGRTIWQVSPEIWHEAGGLARVMQYHGVGMLELIGKSNVKLKMVEPHYQYRIDAEGNTKAFDYGKDITHPFSNLKKVDSFMVTVGGKEVSVEVSSGVNNLGVESYLIRDVQDDGSSFYTHSLYNYRQSWEQQTTLPTWEEFSVFYSKAAFEFLQREETREKARKEKDREVSSDAPEWKAPIIHTNDSQTALVGIYAFIKREEERAKWEKDPKFKINPILEEMIIAFTTHTYNNRTEYPIAEGQGDNVLDFMEIPEKYREFFKHHKDGGKQFYSMASGGLRTADWQGAVARTHMEDVSIYDEWISSSDKEIFREYGIDVDLIAVSNGDNLEKTAEFFRNIGKELSAENDNFGTFDPKRPTAEQVRKIKVKAKEQLTLEQGMERGKHYYSSYEADGHPLLDPMKPVISTSGRLVPEKTGRLRAFTDENIERLVKEGYQVVIYGNVQTKNTQSTRLKEEFITLAARLKGKKYKGRFIFVPRFTLQDQRVLLAATDIQVQDSDVYKTGWEHKPLMGTEAAGYTEANISACGGLQLAPPRPGNGEGLLKAQGLQIDLETPGKGNTLIPLVEDPSDPSTWTSAAYLDILLRTLEKGPEALSEYQATSVKLSSILNARLTAAEYLRQFSMAVIKKRQKEIRRKLYSQDKKEREEKMKLLNQVKVPNAKYSPKEFAVFTISKKILEQKMEDAVSLFFTNNASKNPSEYKKIAEEISNNFIERHSKDGSMGELFRRFAFDLNQAIFQVMSDDEAYTKTSQELQLIIGQALTIMSWIDRHVPGAEGIRVTTNKDKMARSKKGESFLDITSFPKGVEEVKDEGAKGFFWRGIEGVKKIGNNIIENVINTKSVHYKRIEAMKDKMDLYLLDHGFIAVPEGLKVATDEKRITTMHETAFLNDVLPLSPQMTSTGPGHFQGNGLDIKYVTEGEGVQVNVLYNEKNEIVDVIVQPLEEGTFTVALPGYVDYMINRGGLRFNDISIALTEAEVRAFSPNWDKVKNAGISPTIAPLMMIKTSGEDLLVRNKEVSLSVNIDTISKDSFSAVMGKMFSLIDVYQFKLAAGEKEIDKMVKLFLEAKEEAFINRELMKNVVSELEVGRETKEEKLISFKKTKGINNFIEDNKEFLETIFTTETKELKLLRIALETVEQDEATGIKDFIKTLEETGKFQIQLFNAETPGLEVPVSTYSKYGIKKASSKKLIEISKANSITIVPVEKGEKFTPSEENVCWQKLGELTPGRKCTTKDTIVLPVGYNYDGAGLVRSIFLGLSLCEIAKKNYDVDHPFVSSTYEQYKDFCLSQGVDQREFTLTKEDIYNMAGTVGIKTFTMSLNSLIRALPIVPLNIEEIRAIHERAKEAMIRA